MKYRDGKEAKNGDKVVHTDNTGKVLGVGHLYDLDPGNEHPSATLEQIDGPPIIVTVDECILHEDAEKYDVMVEEPSEVEEDDEPPAKDEDDQIDPTIEDFEDILSMGEDSETD